MARAALQAAMAPAAPERTPESQRFAEVIEAQRALEAEIAAVDQAQEKRSDARTILAGDFVPLSERTLEARARRRNPDSSKLSKAATSKNARIELKRRIEGLSASTTFARPLFDKGDLYRAIIYAVRVRG